VAEAGEERAHSSLGEVCRPLALGAALQYLLCPFHRPILRVDDGSPDALSAGDAFGGHVACTGVYSTYAKEITVAPSPELSDGFRWLGGMGGG